MKIIYFPVFILSTFITHAQISDSIVGLNNSPLPNVYFTKVDINSGVTTTGQLVTLGLSSNFTSCINYNTYEFYHCDGQILKTIDVGTGNIVGIDTLLTNSTFTMYKYNPCDSNIYGYIYSGTTYNFIKYNPLTRTFNTISPLPTSAGMPWGALAVIDPDSGLLIIDVGNAITGLELNTGNVRYSTLKINLPNESFGHITLKCSTHEIIGTSANLNAGLKYLSKIDPYTGIVSHISTTGWNLGVWKPTGGGACINQLSGDYFYSGAGGLLIRINSVTGNLISSQTVSNNEFYYVDHFSTCDCKKTSSNIANEINYNFPVTINLQNNIMDVKGENEKYIIEIFDLQSRLILKKIFNESMSINFSYLNDGLYIFKIHSDKQHSISGKFFISSLY